MNQLKKTADQHILSILALLFVMHSAPNIFMCVILKHAAGDNLPPMADIHLYPWKIWQGKKADIHLAEQILAKIHAPSPPKPMTDICGCPLADQIHYKHGGRFKACTRDMLK